jgi:23S rRNA (cytidine1920-2'-O)/16S rRNA (cytidine1409-2'-O)-methyltransferase
MAGELVTGGRVLVNGAPTDRASRLVDPADAVTIVGPPARFVGRGGEKLLAALEAFPSARAAVSGARALDCGASTGGFTDCLLQHGAVSVVALDVGHGQLHERLRADDRVDVVERTNLRTVDPAAIGAPFDVVVADLSFISLRTVAPAVVAMCQPVATMILLVKPQFEVGRADAARGRGVIDDDGLRRGALDGVVGAFTELGCTERGWIESPIHGADGNREFLLWLEAPDGGDG